jgi:dTDP-4-dehydrorhamnose reductase
MKTLLITGAGGFLGSNACRLLAGDYRVVGLAHIRKPDIPDIIWRQADLTERGIAERLLDELRPDGVLHLAAMADASACAHHPKLSERINVEAPVALASACAARDISYVFASTDLVFDGKRAPYDETSPTAPLSLYGKQKVDAEQRILEVYSAAAVCRLPLMYGAAPKGAERFFQAWLKALREGTGLNAFTDEIRTPVSATDAVRGLRLALESGVSGILHLGGPESVSRYEFGRLMADIWGQNPELVRPVSLKDMTFSVPRPRDVSLDSRRAFALGYQPSPVKAELERIAAEEGRAVDARRDRVRHRAFGGQF